MYRSQTASLQPGIDPNNQRWVHDQRAHQAKEDSEHDNKTEVTHDQETERSEQRKITTDGTDPWLN